MKSENKKIKFVYNQHEVEAEITDGEISGCWVLDHMTQERVMELKLIDELTAAIRLEYMGA